VIIALGTLIAYAIRVARERTSGAEHSA